MNILAGLVKGFVPEQTIDAWRDRALRRQNPIAVPPLSSIHYYLSQFCMLLVLAKQPGLLLRYIVALLCAIAALVLRWLLDPWLGENLPFLTVFGGVALAVWYGRWQPATMAALIGFLGAVWLFFPPRGQFDLDKPLVFVGAAGFAFSTGFIIFFGEAMHRARQRAQINASERARAQENETRERELLAVTLASIGDAVIATDTGGRVSFLNPEAERLTGWERVDALGKPLPEVFRIFNENTRQAVENPVDKVIRHGVVVGLANHTILVSKSGAEIPIDDSAAPIRSPTGVLSGVVLVFRDVTEQRGAQEAKARLAAIVEHSADAIFTKDIHGIITTWNASAQRLFGYEAQEIVGKPVTVLFPPDRLDEENHILDHLRKGQAVKRFETVRISKAGRHIPVEISVSPLKNAEGHVIGASKIVHDISAAIAAREALTREKELLATTLASIGDAVIMTDAEGHISFLNGEAERLTGWSARDAAGKPLPEVFRIVNEETRAVVEDPVAKVLRLGQVVGLANHTVLISKDGSETPIDDSAAPIRVPGGALFGVVLVFRDFTERRKSAQELEKREESLRRVKEELEGALRAKDQFLAQLSHELRTPLNPVLMLASARAEDPEVPEDVRKDLDMIRRNVALEAKLIDDLLDLTRIARGKLQLRHSPCDINTIIQDAVEIVRDDVRERQITLKLDLQARANRFIGDATRLHQVIWNLLRNAVKFTPTGGSIHVRTADQNGESPPAIKIEVADEGVGFDPSEAETIFEPFRQGAEGHSLGLGLGLSIARAIVQLHEGTIEGKSAGAGKGAVFTVTLPVSASTESRADTKAGTPDFSPVVTQLRVLLVEDDKSTLQVLAKLLSDAGHKVTAVSSVAAARAAVEAGAFDLLISDLGLPDGTGTDLLRDLRMKCGNLPAIALSGFGTEADVQRSLMAGFSLHLVKPIEAADLNGAIKNVKGR